MAGKKHIALSNQTNIIAVKWDATFFFERAVRSLDRNHYDKALKYFRLAVEYEPKNPVNQCNLAGVLSELGNYAESNQVLDLIIDTIDPSMTECLFYKANNYANLEMYIEAEHALVAYLQEDADGVYLEDAEEMLEYLQYELDRPTKLTSIKARAGVVEHDLARELLEDGKFHEAVQMLEQIVAEQPDFLAAHNNLALAYYYMGKFQQALEAAYSVLEKDNGNLHALCNLAIFYKHEEDEEQLYEMILLLRKLAPFEEDHLFKLATTMGILGEHEYAYRHFTRIIRSQQAMIDPSLYHYAAVAACNMERYEEAKRLWKQVIKIDPVSDIPHYFLSQMELKQSEQITTSLNYHYHLPFEQQFAEWEHSPSGMPDYVKNDPLVRSSFFWALRHGDTNTKLQVIQALGMIADSEVELVLRSFVKEAEEFDYLKKMAIFVLRSIGVQEPISAMLGGKEIVVGANRLPMSLPIWENSWEEVMNLARQKMDQQYDLIQQYDMMTLWGDFLSKLYPNTPKISKPASWSAALEYLTAKMHRRTISYYEVAQKYDVSISTVSRHVRLIDATCNIKEKMISLNAVLQPNESEQKE
ncbi:tetratricopeptide repeat protein [Paenibacillus yanchengensis]|uniref:Tetratricopeptide repeat protein n=1 Tax=Paenibacillus yanchengensis TaxID=2035833 RepID=A0ABW4YGQ9_9BACL